MGSIRKGGLYCAYLRKSRRDMELEALGQGETLARHEKQLTDLAARLGVAILHTYREIVSGDTIAERPEMQRLLADVSAGRWDGVLCMDVDRLARGDSMDQGLIMQTLLYANVLVVTPDKIYDPSDDSDADFFEIKLFFARREYAAIKKRMLRGRVASVMDGCYLGPKIYGYERVKLQGRKGWSLRVIPEQAAIVRSVFEWYAYGMDGREVGVAMICRRLNELGVRNNNGQPFEKPALTHMLQNPTYAGKSRYRQRVLERSIQGGKRVTRCVKSDHPIIVDGLHDAIVDPELFDRVQQMFSAHEKRPRNIGAPVVNPFGGLVKCAQCGRTMQYKYYPDRDAGYLFCPRQGCKTASTYINVVEGVVIDGLRDWVSRYEVAPEPHPERPDPGREAVAAARAQLEAQLRTLDAQSGRLYDLLEQGLYTPDVYLQRRADLDARIAEARAGLDAIGNPAQPDAISTIVPKIRTVLDAYSAAATAAEKCALFSSVLDHILYDKTQRCYRNNSPTDHLTLTLFPKIPESPLF